MSRVKGRYSVVAEMTLQEIGDIEGCSSRRIYQIEQRAFKKIRKYLLERFGNSVTIEELLPILKGDNKHEMYQLR